MQVILKFPSEATRVLIEDISQEQLLALQPLDTLISRLQTWGVFYNKQKHVPVSSTFVSNSESINFIITMEVAK